MWTLTMNERNREDQLTHDFPLVPNRFRHLSRDHIYTSGGSIRRESNKVIEHDERNWLVTENPCDLFARVDNLPDRVYRLMAVAFCRLTWTRLNKVHRRVVQVAEHVAEDQYPAESVETLLGNHRESLTSTDAGVPWAFNRDEGDDAYTSLISADDYYVSREPRSGGVAPFERDMAKEDMKQWRRMYAERAAYCICLYNPRQAAAQVLRHVLATGLSKERASMAINVLNRGTLSDPKTAAKLCNVIRDTIGNPYRQYPPIHLDLLRWNNGSILQMAQHIYDNRDFGVMPILADMLEEADAEPVFVEHARHGGYHYRGCWLLDALLNKREA